MSALRSVDCTAAVIVRRPQNEVAILGQSAQLTCASDGGTCDSVIWARTNQNRASVIIHAAGPMLEVRTVPERFRDEALIIHQWRH